MFAQEQREIKHVPSGIADFTTRRVITYTVVNIFKIFTQTLDLSVFKLIF